MSLALMKTPSIFDPLVKAALKRKFGITTSGTSVSFSRAVTVPNGSGTALSLRFAGAASGWFLSSLGWAYCPDNSTTPIFGLGRLGGGDDGVGLSSGTALFWCSGAFGAPSADLRLVRDAANTLAQRNGTAAQTKRLYFSFTDSSNYTRLAFKTASGVHTIETESAGTGEPNIDLALVPKGTGAVRFGTHAALAGETVTGYVTIKDTAGNTRKLAVVS